MPLEYELAGVLLFTGLAILPALPFFVFVVRFFLRRDLSAKRLMILSFILVLVLYVMVCVDAFLLEPNWPHLVKISLPGKVSKPLTILQLSDLHIEKDTPFRERWLFDAIKKIHPDLILLTGDLHQIDNGAMGVLHKKLGGLSALMGVFACSGYDSVKMMNEACPNIVWLENRALLLQYEADTIGLAGLCGAGQRGPIYESIAGADFRLAMNHTPGLVDEAAAHGMDLYLCGHTHGGQVRIPFWGAIITNSPTGKRFEQGLSFINKMAVYTSSGLGLEPPPAPQVRFLCRPEITLITVIPSRN